MPRPTGGVDWVGLGQCATCGAGLSWVTVLVLRVPVSMAHCVSLVPAFLSSGSAFPCLCCPVLRRPPEWPLTDGAGDTQTCDTE